MIPHYKQDYDKYKNAICSYPLIFDPEKVLEVIDKLPAKSTLYGEWCAIYFLGVAKDHIGNHFSSTQCLKKKQQRQ